MANYEHELNFTFGEFYYETALAGYVYSNTADEFIPIGNAHIVISNPNNWFSFETFTNEDGAFWASLPSAGMYYVVIRADGYIDFDDYVNLIGSKEYDLVV